MNLVTPTELARIITEKTGEPFTRQAVHKAITEGLLPFTTQGKRKMVDLDDRAVKQYMSGNNRQREQAKKNDKKTVAPSRKPARKQPKPAATSEKPSTPDDELTPYEITQRTKIAAMKKVELDVEIKQKKYLPTEFNEKCYIGYIERLHTVLERSSSVFIQEVGKEILSDGEVLPAHINKFTDMILEAIHNNKKSVIREFQKYEPK